MYRKIVLHDPHQAQKFLDALSQFRSHLFAENRIKSLYIFPEICNRVAHEALTVCTGLQNVSIRSTPPFSDPGGLLHLLSSLPLTSLSINLTALITRTRPPKPTLLLSDTMFTQLTHLEVLGSRSLELSSFGIEHLPRLTHLACQFLRTTDFAVTLCHILDKSPRLEVLVLLAGAYVFRRCKMHMEKDGTIRDIRVVMRPLTFRNWDKAEEEFEGEGTWEVAERIVRWRRDTRGNLYPMISTCSRFF
ncbi:hypothetical protein F5I97DRAFT_266336 [Phlebopus sp. FC_14]|nr:hypothetical protein F5I97DRAFT_266336 [Phlebopus sp. FC_14]